MIEVPRSSLPPLVKVELTLSAGGHIHCEVSGAAGDKFWLMGFLQQALLGLAAQPGSPLGLPEPLRGFNK